MRFDEQGTVGNARYSVVPRTLSFILCDGRLLLLRGASDKRLWASRLNGLGGHLEPGEDPYAGALREIREEAGLEPDRLALRALIHVSGQASHPGVVLFVFLGHTTSPRTLSSAEGTLEWHPLDALPWDEMVADLPHLIPRLLGETGTFLYGVYDSGPDGEISYHWRAEAECRGGAHAACE